MPAMPQAIHAAAWMDPPDLPSLPPGRMTASKRASLVRLADIFGLTVAEVPQRWAAEIAPMQPTEAERQRGRVRRRIPRLGADSVAVDAITRAWEAVGDNNDSTRPWTDFATNTLGYPTF